ncbi:MAG: EAL domain-containing protein [Parashewanella sp.]
MPFRYIYIFFAFLIFFGANIGISLATEHVSQPVSVQAVLSATNVINNSTSPIEKVSSIPDSHIILNTERYGVAEGLSQSTVTSVVEDHDGFLWIGTVNGLNRFDGTNFKAYYTEDGLPSSFIRSLFVTDEGKLLVGTDRGLAIYNNSNDDFKINNNSFINKPIWSINSDNNDIIFNTSKSIIKTNNKIQKHLTLYKENSDTIIKKIIKTENNIYFKSYNKQLFRVDSRNKKTLITKKIDSISKIDNKLIFSNSNGTFTLENNKFKLYNHINYNYLSTSENELFGINKDRIHNISKRKELGSLNLESNNLTFAKKINNSIYIGTLDIGLLKSTTRKNIINKINVTNLSVWNITRNNKNTYIATTEPRIHVLGESLETIRVINDVQPGYKHLWAQNEDLYYGTREGLFIIKNNEIKQVLADSVTYVTGLESKIYIGTSNGKIIELTENKIINQYVIKKWEPIYNINIMGKEGLAISTSSGLFIKRNGSITLLDKEPTNGSCFSQNNLYYGTNSALKKYNLKTQDKEQITNSNKTIYSLYCDDYDLVATSQNEVIYKNQSHKKYHFLNQQNGSQVEYNTSPIIKTKEGFILAGTEGVSILNKERLITSTNKKNKLKTNLTQVLLFNKSIINNKKHYTGALNKAESIIISHSDSPITLKFSTLASNSTYFYRMLGLKEDWIPADTNNSATFTNLPHGTFKFEVYSFDNLTHLKGDVTSLQIVITPPWWFSFQAKIFYSLIVFIIILLIIKFIISRREIQKRIAFSEERLKLSLWGSGDEIWDWDITNGDIYRSNMWQNLNFPVMGERIDHEDQETNIHPMDRARVDKALDDHLKNRTEIFEISYRVKDKFNNWVWILDRAKVVERTHDGKPLRMTGTIKNINEFKRNEEKLRLFATAITNMDEGMFILNNEFEFIELNDACCAITQMDREDFIGKPINFSKYPASFTRQVQHMLKHQGRWAREIEALRGDGTTFLLDMSIDAIEDKQDKTRHYIAVFTDITSTKQHEDELRNLTINDQLTKLPNRSYLNVTMKNLADRSEAYALMVLDLDNFKKINDSLGHHVGDELLKLASKRMSESLSQNAHLYRLGGDEFAILIEKNADITSAANIAKRVINSLEQPITLEQQRIVIGASLGIVFYPDDERNNQEVLRKADMAMYSAKSAGGSCYHFYSESLNKNAVRQLEVENLIHEGLANDYFEVYYQPKVDIKTNSIMGMEALVRLVHPHKGIISPSEFIPLAEKTELIVDIGDIVLKKACQATQIWREQYNFTGRVAVNLSSRQFALADLEDRIKQVLADTGLPASSLEIEITEGTVIQHPEKAIQVMEKLAKMGIHLALDDFGTGYSSLSYLKKFPINTLKIDKTFIDDIDKSDRDLKMVDSIITIAHNMDLTVVAEGVEEQSQLTILKTLDCEVIQGFIFSKPIDKQEFSKII